jgi:hypothetical protein
MSRDEIKPMMDEYQALVSQAFEDEKARQEALDIDKRLLHMMGLYTLSVLSNPGDGDDAMQMGNVRYLVSTHVKLAITALKRALGEGEEVHA